MMMAMNAQPVLKLYRKRTPPYVSIVLRAPFGTPWPPCCLGFYICSSSSIVVWVYWALPLWEPDKVQSKVLSEVVCIQHVLLLWSERERECASSTTSREKVHKVCSYPLSFSYSLLVYCCAELYMYQSGRRYGRQGQHNKVSSLLPFSRGIGWKTGRKADSFIWLLSD